MSVDLRLAAEKITEQLRSIGIADVKVEVVLIDDPSDSYTVEVTSDAFQGQTFLDREMRIRPAVARAFSSLGDVRAEFVIDPRTPDESIPSPHEGSDSAPVIADDQSDAVSRAAWRDDTKAVVRALEKSHYVVSPVEEGFVYIARRAQLADQRFVLGFARSVNASTVDLDIRRAIQIAKDSQKISSCFYIAPHPLSKPFANQTNARWLQLHTPTSFLHSLNASSELASNLRDRVDKAAASLHPEHRGHVIEPDLRFSDNTTVKSSFFQSVATWRDTKGPSLLLVMAPAGHGKTTLTLELARRLAAGFLTSRDNEPVPLFVPFESVRRLVDFESLLHKNLAELSPGTLGAYGELLRRNEAVLIVDGFDELADDAGMEVAEAQIRSMRFLLEGNAKVLIAGRSLFTELFAGGRTVTDRLRSLLGDVDVRVVEILSFDLGNIEEYVRSRDGLTPAQAESVLRFAHASPDHEQVCGNPLFLRILCSLAASGDLPESERVAEGLDALIEKVCAREEVRQQLGIGVAVQRDYLGWLAADLHRSGTLSLSASDVREAAQLFVEEHVENPSGEIVGRLVDHALLSKAADGHIRFIHPLIRDVSLGYAIEHEAQRTGVDKIAILKDRDLPEGCVRYLARKSSVLISKLPTAWLSNPESLRATARRNVFRIVTRRARFSDGGNPRIWLTDSRWVEQGCIRELALSALPVESVSFDDLKLITCDATGTYFDDCDFRGSEFRDCNLVETSFVGCRTDENLEVFDCKIVNVEVRSERSRSVARGGDDLVQGLRRADIGAQLTGAPSTDAVVRARELTADVLRQLVQVEPHPRFHTLREEELRSTGTSDRENVALDRVVIPTVVHRFCTVTLGGSSHRTIAIDKRWQNTVVMFLRGAVPTPQLQSVLSTIAVRAARFLQ